MESQGNKIRLIFISHGIQHTSLPASLTTLTENTLQQSNMAFSSTHIKGEAYTHFLANHPGVSIAVETRSIV